MAIKIAKKIVGYEVVKEEEAEPLKGVAPAEAANAPDIEHMHEQLERPEMLEGSTYKIKTPLSEHALYVTINDIVLNPGTEHELRRPFEIFINSKNMDHFQWIVALTRIISAVFRKGGDCTFLVEELRSVFDPAAATSRRAALHALPGGRDRRRDRVHLRKIGMIHQKKLIQEKRAQYEASAKTAETSEAGDFPAGSQLCNKCNVKAAIVMDGCLTCLNCGESKCG
jgi:hypothetical protein